MIVFYCERKNIFGKWSPETSPERPESKSASGVRREIRNVHEVLPHMEVVGLDVLRRHFNQPVEVLVAPLEEFDIPPSIRNYEALPIKNDADGHLIELALDNGFQMINDDGTVFAVKQDDLLKLMKVLTDPVHTITILARQVHADNVAAGWWTDLKTGEDLHGKRNVPEMLMLIVSEVAEGMEGHRKRLMDDKLPHRPMLRVELIDAMIRMFDLLGSQDNEEHPAGAIFQEKRAYNAKRADHKPDARLAAGGKAF